MKCVICGNNIKEGLQECPICGSKQLSNPIYNTQQYDELQTQIQQTQAIDVEQINRKLQEQQMQYQQPIPQQFQQVPYQQPVQQQYQSNYQQMYQNVYQQPMFVPNPAPIPVVQKKSSFDIISTIVGCIGIFFAYGVITIISDGINEFIIENFSDPKYADFVSNPFSVAFSMTWVLFVPSIIGLIFGLKGRKITKNGLNTFGVISNSIVLAVGAVSLFYIYNYLS